MSTLKVDTLQHRDGTEYILSERNKLINGDFSVAQRGTSITSQRTLRIMMLITRWTDNNYLVMVMI